MSEAKYPAYEVVEWRGHYKVIEFAKLETGWRFNDGGVATSLCQRLNALEARATAAAAERDQWHQHTETVTKGAARLARKLAATEERLQVAVAALRVVKQAYDDDEYELVRCLKATTEDALAALDAARDGTVPATE